MPGHATCGARELLRYGNDLDGVVRILLLADEGALVAERTGGETLLLAELDESEGEGIREAIAIALQYKTAPLRCRTYERRELEAHELEPAMAFAA